MILLALKLMTVRGGMSFGAFSSLSENGLMVFGSLTRISSLHQEMALSLNSGSCIFNQQGPIIFLFRTKSSNADVFVPKTREKVFPETSSGRLGSMGSTISQRDQAFVVRLAAYGRMHTEP